MKYFVPDSPEELSRLVADMCGQESFPPGPDDNIFDFGLDSLRIFSLLSAWNAEGLSVDYPELASAPTLRLWWQLIQKNQRFFHGKTR